MQIATETTIAKPRISRVMLPDSARMTPEASDIEDARKIRYGVSPSYYLNLGHMAGNQFTGYDVIYPRRLYRFDWVYPTGINESPDRMDPEKTDQPATIPTKRSPRTCAMDVKMEADDRVFVVFSALTDRGDAFRIWDVIFPVEVEAEIFAATLRKQRGPVPEYLREYYAATKVNAPFIKDGPALQMFVDHLERVAPRLILEAGFDEETYDVAETTLREILQGANDAFQHRYHRLNTSFGSMQSQRTSGKGKRKLDDHDKECLAETGIKQPEDKPIEATQKMGQAIGESIADRSAASEGHLANAVAKLAEGQEQTNKILQLLLEERSERRQAESASSA